jgi:predicted dehydrogenase
VVEAHATRAAEKAAGCRPFGPDGWEAFLESGINAVMVASPIPHHVAQSVACLERGLHVLCEVTAAMDLDEAQRLARAAGGSSATYMLAENCCFIDEIELFKRMNNDGLFGELFYADGGYLHDCRYLWRNEDGSFTWRARDFTTKVVYCTHSLGPIIDIFGERITVVSCLDTPVSLIDEEVGGTNNHCMLMRTAGGRTVFQRIDSMSPQPYRLPFRLQGTKGVCEYVCGEDPEPRICRNGSHKWEPVAEYRREYLADREGLSEEAKSVGHGSMEYWMMKAWSDALLHGRPVPIDFHRALDYTLPGIMAVQSARRNGEPMAVPNSRDWV